MSYVTERVIRDRASSVKIMSNAAKHFDNLATLVCYRYLHNYFDGSTKITSPIQLKL